MVDLELTQWNISIIRWQKYVVQHLNLLNSVRDVEEINIPAVKTSFLGTSSSNVGYSSEGDMHTIFTCRGDFRATLQETISVMVFL